MQKDKILHINVFDGDDGIKYIRYNDMEKMLKRIKEVHDKIEYELKAEIKRLKEEIKGYEQERERVLNIIEERNHKAIEYIEQQYKYEETAKEDYDILLDILKGSDKDVSSKEL